MILTFEIWIFQCHLVYIVELDGKRIHHQSIVTSSVMTRCHGMMHVWLVREWVGTWPVYMIERHKFILTVRLPYIVYYHSRFYYIYVDVLLFWSPCLKGHVSLKPVNRLFSFAFDSHSLTKIVIVKEDYLKTIKIFFHFDTCTNWFTEFFWYGRYL